MNETIFLKISSGRHLKPVLHEHLRLKQLQKRTLRIDEMPGLKDLSDLQRSTQTKLGANSTHSFTTNHHQQQILEENYDDYPLDDKFMKLPQSITKQQEQINYHSSFYGDEEESEPITVLEKKVTPVVATVEQNEQTSKPWKA